jgi:hypothetical protein
MIYVIGIVVIVRTSILSYFLWKTMHAPNLHFVELGWAYILTSMYFNRD